MDPTGLRSGTAKPLVTIESALRTRQSRHQFAPGRRRHLPIRAPSAQLQARCSGSKSPVPPSMAGVAARQPQHGVAPRRRCPSPSEVAHASRADTRDTSKCQTSVMPRFRLTGLGTPFGSIQWDMQPDDRERARQVIGLLEDRRLLYVDTAWEIPSECIHSADRTRHDLSAILNTPGIGAALAAQVKLLRSYFRTFMTDARELDGARYRMGADPLSVALGELRAKVGLIVGDLATRFDLAIEEELASIVPLDEGGFFEAVLK